MSKQDDFFALLDHFTSAAVIIDSEQTLLCANTAFEELLGYKRSALIGQSFAGLSQKELGSNSETIPFLSSNGTTVFLSPSSSEVKFSGQTFTLVLLHPAEYSELSSIDNQIALQEKAIDTWRIGVFEYSHIDDRFYVSPFLRELHGLSDGQSLELKMIMEAVIEADRQRVFDSIAESHDPTGDGNLDVLHRIKRDHKVCWIHTRAQTRFREVDGEVIALSTIGTVMDVTEQKTLEQKIIRNEERLKQAIELSQVGFFEHDHLHSPTGSEAYWSPKFREILGASGDQQLSLDWYLSNIHSEDLKLFSAAIQESHDPSGNGDFILEYRWSHPDGKVRWLATRGKTLFSDIDGVSSPVRSVGAVIDITERKETEEERQRHTAILEATPDFVSITDTEGNLIYLNQAGRSLLGFTADEDVSNQNMSLAHTEASLNALENEGLQTLFNTGVWVAESEFISYDNNVVPMSQVLLIHRNNKGEMDCISTIARDLSKEKSLEEQFQQVQKMEAIGRLAGGIAHDFNNMLSVIMGFTSLAVDKIGLEHEANEELDEVMLAAERAAALTGQLLSFSRKQIFHLQVIDIDQVLLTMEPMLKRLVNESIQISIESSANDSRIKVDPNQMEQVFLNLVVNASDAMPQGGDLKIVLDQVVFDEDFVEKQLRLPSGDYIEITISDTGQGMDSLTREKIFEPFFTTKEVGHGTGLGLATVFGIVAQSGGGILVDSEVGKGTTFKLYFPRTEEELTLEDELVMFEATLPHPGGVVLVVEDERQLKEMAVTCLKGAGYTVLSAEDPQAALDIAGDYNGNIDLLLTDVVMPIMTGKELADTLLEVRPATSVLYMSGYTEDSIVHHGVLNDDVNFIAKPITPRGLLATVEQLLGQAAEQLQSSSI